MIIILISAVAVALGVVGVIEIIERFCTATSTSEDLVVSLEDWAGPPGEVFNLSEIDDMQSINKGPRDRSFWNTAYLFIQRSNREYKKELRKRYGL